MEALEEKKWQKWVEAEGKVARKKECVDKKKKKELLKKREEEREQHKQDKLDATLKKSLKKCMNEFRVQFHQVLPYTKVLPFQHPSRSL